VPVDAFAVLAEPTRRRILDELRRSESSVGRLVTVLEVSQPALSKHLKVLRDAGFVSCRTAAQQRIYRVETAPLRAVDGWLAPYRRLWERHLDALERHLDRSAARPDAAPPDPAVPPERRARPTPPDHNREEDR
jgi:DNA-binding transcriptional ArsR family regulator